MTKGIVTALALAGTIFVLPTVADAACTIKASHSNTSQFKDSVTGKDCVPTPAEKSTISTSKSNASSYKEGDKPKGSPTTIGSGTSGAGSGK